jgi:hypothetical protein
MSTQPVTKRPLTQLNFEIEEAELEAARLEDERKAVAKDVARASRRRRYFQLAQSARGPKRSFELWPTVLMIFGPLTCGILLLILAHLVTGSFALAILAFLAGTAAGVAAFGALLFQPVDALLPAAITEAEAQSRLATARLEEKLGRVAEVKQRLQQLIDERRDQIASGKLQRAALLQRNWKAMRGAEWEDFIVEVLRTHGAQVERTGRPGDGGPNLIAEYGSRRVVLFTEGEGQPVASSTIQQALAAINRLGVDACAVIINRRFTGAAQDFAKRNGCTAIGSSEFPDFVMEKISI